MRAGIRRILLARAVVVATAVIVATAGCTTADRAGGTAPQGPRILTFAQPNRGDPPAQLTHWADEVNRLTNGSIQVRFENGWRAGEASAMTNTLEDVKSGKVDLAWLGPQELDRRGVTSFQALVAPMLVDSYDLEGAVFAQGIPKEMLTGLDKIDLVGIGVLPGPLRHLLGITSTFTETRDFVGKTIGVSLSVLAEQTIKALGGIPKGPPFSSALTDVDAIEAHVGAVTGNGYEAYAKALTGNLNLWPRPLIIVTGKSLDDALSAQQRQALRLAVDNLLTFGLTSSRTEDEDSLTALCGTGLPIASVDEKGMAAFRQKLDPVYASLRMDPTNARFLQRIDALKKKVGAPPDRLDCSRDDKAAGAVPNGIYEHPVTPADVAHYCRPDDPSATAFSNLPATGLILQLQVNGEHLVQSGYPVGRPTAKEVGWIGTYRTYRNILELIEDRHTGGVRLTWSLDGTRLQLRDWHEEDCAGEIVWTSHPWVKVGS